MKCVRATTSRETGDRSKIRDFLPPDKQYLVTRGVPCLRRATSLAYTDADEDAERLLSFSDTSGDEWVETHAGRRSALVSLQNPGEIRDIPDLDGTGEMTNGIHLIDGGSAGKEKEMSEIPDLDDIPDMEEDLEGEDEATAAKRKPPSSIPLSSKFNVDQGCVVDVRHVTSCSSQLSLHGTSSPQLCHSEANFCVVQPN